jgi:hypothetical protein
MTNPTVPRLGKYATFDAGISDEILPEDARIVSEFNRAAEALTTTAIEAVGKAQRSPDLTPRGRAAALQKTRDEAVSRIDGLRRSMIAPIDERARAIRQQIPATLPLPVRLRPPADDLLASPAAVARRSDALAEDRRTLEKIEGVLRKQDTIQRELTLRSAAQRATDDDLTTLRAAQRNAGHDLVGLISRALSEELTAIYWSRAKPELRAELEARDAAKNLIAHNSRAFISAIDDAIARASQ